MSSVIIKETIVPAQCQDAITKFIDFAKATCFGIKGPTILPYEKRYLHFHKDSVTVMGDDERLVFSVLLLGTHQLFGGVWAAHGASLKFEFILTPVGDYRLIYTTPTDHQNDYEAILFGKLFGSLVASQLLGVANTYRSDVGCHLVKDINVFKKLVYCGVISKDRVPDIKSFPALVANDKMEEYAYTLEDGCLEDTIHYFRKRLARLEELLKEAEQ